MSDVREIYPEHEGWYWVMFRSVAYPNGLWTVLYWRSEEWWEGLGDEQFIYADDDRLIEIGPEIIPPPQ